MVLVVQILLILALQGLIQPLVVHLHLHIELQKVVVEQVHMFQHPQVMEKMVVLVVELVQSLDLVVDQHYNQHKILVFQ